MQNIMNHLPAKLALAAIAAMLIFHGPPALGLERLPHEEPETAKLAFNFISLFRYYSSSLDSVLQKDAEETEAKLQKMPFANIHVSLAELVDEFATSGIDISLLVVDIDESLGTMRELLAQSRFEESIELADEISGKLTQAQGDLDVIEDVTRATGEKLRITPHSGGSLSTSYSEVLDRIERIREMLDLYKSLMSDTLLGIKESIEKSPSPTELTLNIEPKVAFVGDNIHFEGILTSQGECLAGREVDILLNGSQYAASVTGPDGYYQGALRLPYWYIHQVQVQALYYPRGEDIGVYIASLSPELELEVLFYEAELGLTVEDKSYPGYEMTIGGRLDYGQSPSPEERKVEIYLDNDFLAEIMVSETFEQKILIAPETELGYHTVTVSAAPMGRYASVSTTAPLEITRATPVTDMDLPRVAMIPGSIALSGRIYSELGPVSGAPIKISLGKSQITLASSEEGTFDTRIKMGMGLSPVGSQDIQIRVIPQEPWHNMLSTTRSMVVVNMISSGGILAILLSLGVLAQSRLRRRRRAALEKMWGATAQPQPVQVYDGDTLIPLLADKRAESQREPRSAILNFYRWTVRLIQAITSALVRPQQTLREFFEENRKSLGPSAIFFQELTRMVERLLYSNYQPTKEDAMKSEQLFHSVEKGIKR
ncbi:MAG: DUF4129 domain-containing protein [Dehalococcoidia bacterium]|nr:DUF4129 domain-containing protein [Dehalococcoidia bacterium]